MKIFSLEESKLPTLVMVFLRAPKLKGLKEMDVIRMIETITEKREETRFKKMAIRYQHCIRLLEYVYETDSLAEVVQIYNFHSRGGNNVAFCLRFATANGKNAFLEGLSDLDDELSSV